MYDIVKASDEEKQIYQLKQASQENVLNILGALYLMEMVFLKRITEGTNELDVFDVSSNLFTLKNWTTRAVPLDDAIIVLAEMLESEDSISTKAFDA